MNTNKTPDMIINPAGDTVFDEKDIMLVLGNDEQFNQLKDIAKEP